MRRPASLCIILLAFAVVLVVLARDLARRRTGVERRRTGVETRLDWLDIAVADEVLYINLDHQGRRRAHVEELIRSWGKRPHRRVPELRAVREHSLTLAHMAAIRYIGAQGGDAFYIVLEDDVDIPAALSREPAQFRAAFNKDFAELGQTDAGAVYLGICLDASQEAGCGFRKCQAWCAHAVMYTPRGARETYSKISEVFDWEGTPYPFDWILWNLFSWPVLGYDIVHFLESPAGDWRGVLVQNRKAEWYEAGITEHNSSAGSWLY